MLLVGQASGQVPVDALPSFTDSDPAKYQGEAPTFSQNIQYDHDGNLLFFVIDGRVFDHEGYLIADNSSTANCMECLFKGIGQFATTLVPGSCTQYYLVAAEFIPSNNHALGYAILDLEQPNPHWPQRHGRVLSFDDITNDPGLDNQFGDAVINAPSWQDNDNSLFQSVSECMINLDEEPEMTWGFENGLQLAIYDTDDLVNQKKLLLAVDEASLYYYEVTSTGINKINSFTQGEPLNSSTSAFGNGTRRPWGGTCAFGKANGTDLLFAMSATETDLTGGPVPSVFLFRIGFNGTVEWLQDITTSTQGPGVLEVTGLVFSPNAQTLYVLQNKAPYLASIDLATYAITDLAGPLTINQPNAFGLGTLALDKAPSGSGLALYALSDTRAACKESPDQPLAPNSWVDPLPVAGTLTQRPTFSYSNGSNITLLPDMHNFNEQQVNTISGSTCCTYRAALAAVHGATLSGSPNLTPSSNPWGTSAEVIFDQDVIVPAGAILNVTGMTWRFSEDARLIIQRGGMATFNGCVLTSYACEGLRWPGIRVEGTTTNHTKHTGAQGRLTLTALTEVQNAVCGVWCARELTPGIADPAYFGGWAKGFNTTFRNCITGVRIEQYARHDQNNNETFNLCRFTECTFINDQDWPVITEAPAAMMLLYDVNGIFIGDCTFKNDAYIAMADPSLRGLGIASLAASFRCLGNMYYTLHSFQNLTAGVLSWDADPMFVSEVDGMDFTNNKFGIIDLGSDDGVYTNNQFATLGTDALGGETSIGLYLIQSERYTVERNLFTRPSGALAPGTGIWFRGPAYEDNRIYDNTFNDLNAACLVQGDHVANVPSGQGNTLEGLQMLCGDHTGNFVDQMIFFDGYIKENQGYAQSINTLAGNRFFSSVDCDGTGVPNPSFEPWVFPGHAQDLHVDYFHHDAAVNPESEPECVVGSWIDIYYDLIQLTPYSGIQFDKEVHCSSGDLDTQDPGGPGPLMLAYYAKIAEHASTLANYQGTVDNGEMPDLVTAIRYQPWHPSHYIRDLLLAKHPLSDEVMLETIYRGEPLDPWHLTQILIDNSPLTDDIWLALNATGVLPAYFQGLLEQFDQGMSTRRLLELELVQRKEEKAILQHRLLVALAADSSVQDRTALLDSIFQADSLGRGVRYRYQVALHREDFALAGTLETMFDEDADATGIIQLGQLQAALQGNWHASNTPQRAELLALAYQENVKGSAHAWAASLAIGATDSLPAAYLPLAYRSAAMPGRSRPAASVEPLLQALPNPTHGMVVLSYPKELSEGTITITDMQGRLVAQHSIADHPALIELDLAHCGPGLYIAQLTTAGLPVGEVKISLVR